LFQLFSFAGGPTQEDVAKHRFTIFPIYFRQRSPDPSLNYTAVVPFYGHLVNRLFRDDIRFVMFPLYSKTRKKDVVVSNYLYPIFDVRHGDNMHGWQAWPLYGHDVKGVTYKTNITDEVETIGGYDHKFVLWPFYLRDHIDIGTDNPEDRVTFIPFYNRSRSPKRDSTSWGFPFGHTLTDDRDKGYHESDWFWPLYVHADGSKTIRRVWPIYSHATSTNGLESHWYGWLLWKKNRLKSDPLDRQRTRILYFLYSDITEKNTQTQEQYHRVDFWPFYTFRRDMEGRQRLQVMSIVEPWLPNNTSVVREYSPVYSFWVDERNPKTGVRTQSLLWNLYRREVKTVGSGARPLGAGASPAEHVPNVFAPEDGRTPKKTIASVKVSLFFGLYQSERNAEGKSMRLFYIPIKKQHTKEAGR
jgi:hypothetical protein